MAIANRGTANVEAARPPRKRRPSGWDNRGPQISVTSVLLDQGNLNTTLHDAFHRLPNLVNALVVGSRDHLVVFDCPRRRVLRHTGRQLDITKEFQCPRFQWR